MVAAVDALRQFADVQDVRTGLVDAIGRQDSPLVQIALIDTMVERTREALASLEPDAGAARLVFTAHSLPVAMATGSDYEATLREASALVAAGAAPALEWELAYQSRSGPPAQAWLEPDVRERIVRELRAIGYQHVTIDLQGYRMGSLNEGVRLRPA